MDACGYIDNIWYIKFSILWLIVCIIRVRGKTPSDYIESGKMVAEVFYLLNYSLYFFLYVISRRSFRKVLIEKMRWRCDCFDQWRLNEMRLDAALRSQQPTTTTRNAINNTSITSRTSITHLRTSSTLRGTTNHYSKPLLTSENLNGVCAFDFAEST